MNEPESVNFEVKTGTVFKVMTIVLLMLVGAQFIGSIKSTILLVLVSIFLAVAISPLITKIRGWMRIKNRNLATGLAFSLIVVILASFFITTIPAVFSRIQDTATQLPKTVEEFVAKDNWLSKLVVQHGVDEDLEELAEYISSLFPEDVEDVIDLIQKIPLAIITFPGILILVLVMTFLMLNDAPAFFKTLEKHLSKDRFEKWGKLGLEMKKVIVGYVSGQFLVALIAGLFALIVMSVLQVDNAIALASIVAFCSLIPLIGAIAGSAIVVVLVLVTDINMGLALAVYFIVYQQLENVTIQPWLQSKQTNLSTLQVILASLIGAQVAGVIGVLLSIPLAACLKIIAIDYFKTHRDRFSDYGFLKKS